MNILGIILGAAIVFVLLFVLGRTGGGVFEDHDDTEE